MKEYIESQTLVPFTVLAPSATYMDVAYLQTLEEGQEPRVYAQRLSLQDAATTVEELQDKLYAAIIEQAKRNVSANLKEAIGKMEGRNTFCLQPVDYAVLAGSIEGLPTERLQQALVFGVKVARDEPGLHIVVTSDYSEATVVAIGFFPHYKYTAVLTE